MLHSKWHLIEHPPTPPPTPPGCLLSSSARCPRASLATTVPWWLGNSGPGNPPTLSHLVLLFSQEVRGICLPIKPPDRHGHAEKGQMLNTPTIEGAQSLVSKTPFENVEHVSAEPIHAVTQR